MKITLELTIPQHLEQLLQSLSQAALVYTEAAQSFPPAECTRPKCASAQVAEPAEQSTAPRKVTLAEAKDKILAMPGGHAIAVEKLKSKGKQKLADLAPDQLVDFLAELGVAP